MLTSITLENYRGFKEYRLAGLSRVNLLVGMNNCGKTAILEAVHLLAAGGDPGVLESVASRRGELILFTPQDADRPRRPAFPDVSHLFHGHEFGPDRYFKVAANNELGELTVRVVRPDDDAQQGEPFDEGSGFRAALAIRLEGARHPLTRAAKALPVSADGALLYSPYRFRRPSGVEREEIPAVQFISPSSVESVSMAEMWNKVIVDAREAEVIEAMRILEPDLTNIFFLSGESAFRFGGRGGIVAAFEHEKQRLPLGSYGEGMHRLLALSLSLIQAANGVLLVDEIDTGLHYSIMGDMWLLVAKAAIKSNVRIFATTHSFDCVRGLAWLCENHPELREFISLQKIDRNLNEAVSLDASKITIAANQGIEVR
ncbi:MAG: AAA family ATPase [Planctomycetota bacterium]